MLATKWGTSWFVLLAKYNWNSQVKEVETGREFRTNEAGEEERI
jgi:hypothetical protein